MSWSSASVGFWPRERMTVPSSLVVMVPSPSLSNREKASLNSAICSSVSCSSTRFIKPPGGRGGQAGPLPIAWRYCPAADNGLPRQELLVDAGPRVPSRRHSGATSPSTVVTPGRREATSGGTPASVVQLELYEEARQHMAKLLEQLPDVGGERAARCLRELEALHGTAGRELHRSVVSVAAAAGLAA